MFPATAVAFIMASASLLLQSGERNRYAGTSLFLALVLVGLGLTSRVLRMLEWAPGPLTLAVFGETTYASVPGAVSAVMFIATGASLGLMHARRTVGLAQAVAVATLLLSILVIAAYFSQGSFLYQLLPERGGIAIRTAVAFAALAIGVLCLRPREGIVAVLAHPATEQPTLRHLFLPAVATPIVLGVLLTAVIDLTGFTVDDTALLWISIWVLLIVLVIVMWRFAYKLHEQESRRRQAEKERNEALAALRAADERKNEFLAMLAHELRNPLSAIGTAADMLTLSQASTSDPVQRTSEVISRQVSHMAHLVDDLMDVSKVVAGIIVLNKQKLDAKQLISDAIEQVHPLLESKGHKLRTELPSGTVQLEGDRTRLIQVFANLLGNAAKYTPAGGDLFLQMVEREDKLVVNVQDNGIGIDPTLLPEVFGLFTQAKRTSNRSQGGLGLGLALVKSLVELHGGEVKAHSEGLGKGSTFTVVLPQASGFWKADVSRPGNLAPNDS